MAADLLQQASQWLGGMRQAHLSRPVVYSRGKESVEVAATVGRTLFEIDDGSGAVERWESRDFLITAAGLVLAGEAVLPAAGDQITDGDKVYEVMAPGKEDCWRYSDPFRVTLRVHTKQVGAEGEGE